MNHSTLQSGPKRDLKESIPVLKALLSVSLGNTQCDRLWFNGTDCGSMGPTVQQATMDRKHVGQRRIENSRCPSKTRHSRSKVEKRRVAHA